LTEEDILSNEGRDRVAQQALEAAAAPAPASGAAAVERAQAVGGLAMADAAPRMASTVVADDGTTIETAGCFAGR
jgi:hypothetical protein